MSLSIEESKVGVPTLKYNNKYIHSKYDPIREASQFIRFNQSSLKENTIVIYGLGLGYHINALLEKVDFRTKIYVFEWNTEIRDLCYKYNKELFGKENIYIISEDNPNFYRILSEKLQVVNDIVIYKPSLLCIKDINEELYTTIKWHSMNKMHSEKDNELLTTNYIINKNGNYEEIDTIINRLKTSKKTFVVTAAGPSLDYELELLKQNRDKFIIITVGSALKSLDKKDIIPDVVVIIDGSEIVKKQVEGYRREEVPLCFLASASRWAVEEYKGPKYIFYNEDSEGKIKITTGKTVAAAALDIAVKCNAKEIVLLGQDLAFLGDKSHTKFYEEIYEVKDEEKKNSKTIKINGVNGRKLETNEGYLYFKKQIENIMEKNSNIRFVNCSSGAIINGAEHMKFKNYIEEHLY